MSSDAEALKAEVASFAASLGLAPSQDGFNDADFRKKGPLKKPKVKADAAAATTCKVRKDETGGKFVKKKKQGDQKGDQNAGGKKKRPYEKAEANPRPGLFDAPKIQLQAENVAAAEKLKFSKDVCNLLSRWGGSGEKWYESAAGVAKSVEFLEVDKALTDHAVKLKRQQAEALLKMVAVEFVKHRKNNSEMEMILSARRSGTSADKVAAMTVLIQENTVANLHTLDSLLGMVTSKGGKRHALSGVDVLKELFVTSLLPDRKLKTFASQALAKLPETKEGTSLLMWWYWEDCVKNRYESYVNAVIEGTKDNLPQLKLKSLKTLYELLSAKPENEKKLLAAIINKLGDPERKAASNACYFLACLLTEHPNMKKIVLQEVELFVFRSNLALRAVYYASVFMNRIPLSSKGDGPDVAKRLIDIYFGLFKNIINKGKKTVRKPPHPGKQDDAKEEAKSPSEHLAVDSRLLSSLLTGINRAFRFVAEDSADAVIEEHTPALFRLVHSSNFNVGIQALLLLHQILSKHQALSDRFFRALYAVMLSPALPKSSKVDMCLALVFKVLKSDVSPSRSCAFLKRLMQVAMHQSPELGCACLVVVSEVLKAKPLLWNFVLEPASEDDDQEHFKDVDENEEDVKNDEVPELTKVEAAAPSADVDSDSDIHVDNDLAKSLGDDESNSDDDLTAKKKKKKKTTKELKPVALSVQKQPEQAPVTPQKLVNSYDPRHRDPHHCKADQTCWWELTILASHIHPSVSTMAKTLLSNANIVYSGDPLHDLAFGAFLDRFAEKKSKRPKKALENADSSRKEAVPKLLVGMELASLPEDEVAPADVIFHRFYCAKAAGKGKRKKQKNDADDSDDELVGSDGEVDEDAEGDETDGEDELEVEADEEEEEDDDDDDGKDEDENLEDEMDFGEDIEADDDSEDDELLHLDTSEGESEDLQGDESEDSQGDDSENEEIDKFLDEEMELIDSGEDIDDESESDGEEFEFGGKPPKILQSADKKQKKNKKKKKDRDEQQKDGDEVTKKTKGKSAGVDHPTAKKSKRKQSDGDEVAKKKKKNESSSSFASSEEYPQLFSNQ